MSVQRGRYSQLPCQLWSALRFGGCICVAMATVVLAAISWNAFPAMAQTQTAATPVTLISGRAIVLNPATGKVYAVDKSRDAVSIFDDGTGRTSSVKVGAAPVAIAINPVTGRVYVANTAAGTVTVLDGKKDVVLATVSVGKKPYVVAVNERTNKIYVSNTFSDMLTVIDGVSNVTTTVKAGSADAIAVDSKADKTYLLSYENADIKVLDGASGSLTTLPVGTHSWGMIHDDAKRILYVTRAGNAELLAFDEGSRAASTIATGAIPCAVGVNSVTNAVYVVNYGDDSVTVINATELRAVATLPVGERPQAIAVDTAANLVYVVNTHGNSVTVIDGARNAIRGTLNAGEHPYAITLDHTRGKVYLANQGGQPFTVIAVPVTPWLHDTQTSLSTGFR